MHCNKPQDAAHRLRTIGRRNFLFTMGASALAIDIGLFDFASSVLAEEPRSAQKPVVHAVFVRPKGDRYWMGWPGTAYDVRPRQADYTKTLTQAAQKFGIQLEMLSEPLHDTPAVDTYVDQLKKDPPAGVLIILMHHDHWRDVYRFVKNRGDIPTVVYSPMGTSFLHNIKPIANAPRTFTASTQEVDWLAFALRMFHTMSEMKNTRICILQGDKMEDVKLDAIGATLHYIPVKRFPEEFNKLETTDEMRAIANYYIKNARKTVEPTEKDVLDAAKNYVVCRRIMAAENCHGIAIDCLPLVEKRLNPPPCLAFSRLRDEGVVASCQADWPAAISSRLTHLLLDRPGFMQNICVNTVNNTLLGSHCTCPTKLSGFDGPAEPFILRTHAESDLGVAVQVLWPVGEKVTVMKFADRGWERKPPSKRSGSLASSIVLGSGRVLCNVDSPPSGGCRTTVEVELDDIDDVRDLMALHHQLFIHGDHTRQLKAYAQLAGIEIRSI
jgi:hypothetical protein